MRENDKLKKKIKELEETCDILADKEIMADIRKSLNQISKGPSNKKVITDNINMFNKRITENIACVDNCDTVIHACILCIIILTLFLIILILI